MKCCRSYTTLAQVGRGSFSTVHQVRRADGRLCALKLVDLTSFSDEKTREQALTEVRILENLRCPFIVQYYDASVVNGRLRILLEYCEEGDLRDFLKRRTERLSDRTVWQIFGSITSGLEYLHARHILHRDVKSANIFLTPSGVRVGDLGQAKQLCNTSCASTLCGTPAYFSPEEALDTEQYTAKCDMWALGVILYELNSENHTMPFVGRNLACLLESIKTKTPRPLPTTTTKPFIHLCDELLEKEAALRPSAGEVLLRPCLSEIVRTHGLADIRLGRENAKSEARCFWRDDDEIKVKSGGSPCMSGSCRPEFRNKPYCEVCAELSGDVCHGMFSAMKRRHHCRMCGLSVCLEHAVGRRTLPHLGYTKPQILCETCLLLPRHIAPILCHPIKGKVSVGIRRMLPTYLYCTRRNSKPHTWRERFVRARGKWRNWKRTGNDIPLSSDNSVAHKGEACAPLDGEIDESMMSVAEPEDEPPDEPTLQMLRWEAALEKEVLITCARQSLGVLSEPESEPGGSEKLDSTERKDTETVDQERARSQAEVVRHAEPEETRIASSRECRKLASLRAEYLTCCKSEGSEVLPSGPCPIKEGLVSQLRLQFEESVKTGSRVLVPAVPLTKKSTKKTSLSDRVALFERLALENAI
eukprot:CAMPEP_0194495834 /NCGR_PEP_ID=MMETSP0253-20130528/13304_1 /TAXON_ID=2966 /ORGANISM="Noctiluca scintillans" /LENGTH=642 /DNA_ID=CAMNT_0039337153 /DNA_START=58 /DNA_END=1986 /DNA_ORIENTATION=-